MKTIAIVNQKGGVGKTTTAVQLASGLSIRGFRVLGVDVDAQANFTATMFGGRERDEAAPTVYDVLIGEASAKDAVADVFRGQLLPSAADVACTDKRLARIDAAVGDKPNKLYLLREALEGLSSSIDYAVIDTPPARDTCSYNALTAADWALIVTEAGEYSVKGIADLAESIRQIKKYTNPSLEIAGVLVTKFEAQTLLGKGMSKGAAEIAEALGTRVFNARIRKAVAIGESQSVEADIFDYAPDSGVAKDYGAFVGELLEVIGDGR